LREVLGHRRHSEPGMHHLFPHREGWRWEVRIGEAAHRDPVDVGVFVAFPEHVAAAVRAEVKADLEAAVRVTLINLVVALYPNLAFRVGAAGMDDSPGAALDGFRRTPMYLGKRKHEMEPSVRNKEL